MPEIINQKELAAVVNGAPVTDDHSGLIAAIHTRYPDTRFSLVAKKSEYCWPAGLVDREGNRVSDNLVAWMDQQLAENNNDARAVWLKHKDSGLIKTEWGGPVLHLTAPYAASPDAFYQIEVVVGSEFTSRPMFDPGQWNIPEDRHDLIRGPSYVFGKHEIRHLTAPSYRLEDLVNMRRFLRDLIEVEKAGRLAELPEMQKKTVHIQDIVLGPEGSQQESSDIPFLELCPDWLDRVPPAARLFRDWQESSPSKEGHRFCDHWFAQYNDYTNRDGKRSLYFCPQWADADGGLDLPEISPDYDASPYGVMESLSEFDRQAGYPFAWYFYMLHGNRVTNSAGHVVAQAIQDGQINPLPECDKKVLLRWKPDKYGF